MLLEFRRVLFRSGNPVPTVQWQLSTDNGVTWTNISGATSTTLTVTNPSVSAGGNQYRAVFTNTCNGNQTATSNAATLMVNKGSTAVTVASGTNPSTFGQNRSEERRVGKE